MKIAKYICLLENDEGEAWSRLHVILISIIAIILGSAFELNGGILGVGIRIYLY